ncbi:DUF6716 putative glycosyltransferase [Actinorugispora endophytica]|uniref:Uncharacterized protein n=1 Tax=Actinorugispora endophytica TaxID=1605990 RepID=A0A4R6V9N3_9ACTN|nr:DUF6716 putative glycosyltransferase [Actinorugispora endophytica]TDQ55558.1 hypothetical protein EV190_101890 [Actinorugispora endophytica]
MTDRGTAHVMAIADSDSYLKWGAGLLDSLPEGWSGELAVVRTPIAPSPSQMRGAVLGTRNGASVPPVLSALALRRTVRRVRPDVIVVACTGPVVDVLVNDVLAGLSPRPVLVSGLPGISVPATEKAWLYRAPVDLFILHSRREVDEFGELGARLGATGEIGLATLPFLAGGPEPGSGAPTIADPPEQAPRDRVVFATQAKVPVQREERELVLRALADLAARRPDLNVVVKLRARAHEQQTHREHHHFETLWHDLVAAGEVPADAVSFADGSMREQLEHAAGFVTVSSTAALEAVAQDVPLLILSDFGVSAEMINLVFEGSEALGTLDDLREGRFRTPSPRWCAENYFHDADGNDWSARLVALVERARAGGLPARPLLLTGPRETARRRRSRLRMDVPPTALRTIGRVRKRIKRVRRRLLSQ